MAKRKEFKDTMEATEFMYKIVRNLHSEKLMDWAEETDGNIGTKTVPLLRKAIKAYDKFIEEMENVNGNSDELKEKSLCFCPCCGSILDQLFSGKRCHDTENCGYHTHETVGL